MSHGSFTPQKRRDRNRTIRYTVDMNADQRKFLTIFALDNDVKASVIFKSLLHLLENRVDLAALVLHTIDTLGSSRALKDNTVRPTRYTVDLDWQQHTFLKLFSVHNDVTAADVVRCLLVLLETRIDLAALLINTIFEDDEDEIEESHEDEEVFDDEKGALAHA